MTIFLLLVIILLTLVGAAFCAGAETAFLSVSRERILHLAREGGRKAKMIERALGDMARTTTTLLIGNNLATVTYSSATAALTTILCGENRLGRAIASFAAAFLVLYVSEFLPKMLCSARPLRRSLALAEAYDLLALLLAPLTRVALAFTNFFVPRQESVYRLTTADLMRILQDRKDGVCLSDVESALISRIIVLRVKGKPITREAILSALRDAD